MATYDLEQQEQLDQLKQFWKQYGNLITWLLVLVMGGYAAYMYYQHWQDGRSTAAASLFEELDRAAQSSNVDKVTQVFGDLKDKYAGTTFAEQGALMASKVAAERQKTDQAKASLQWLVDNGKNANLVAVGRIRLAGLLMDAKQYDEALKTLKADIPAEFAALADDRRGDILMAQGKKDEAIVAYQAAWKAMDPSVEYRRFIDGKLTALGQPPEPMATNKPPLNYGGPLVMQPGMLPKN